MRRLIAETLLPSEETSSLLEELAQKTSISQKILWNRVSVGSLSCQVGPKNNSPISKEAQKGSIESVPNVQRQNQSLHEFH